MAKIRVEVDSYNLNRFDGTIAGFIQEVIAVFNSIPAEYRDAARLSIEGEEYGYSTEVWYERDKTPAEVAAEEEYQAHILAARERTERQHYDRLKAKFEGK